MAAETASATTVPNTQDDDVDFSDSKFLHLRCHLFSQKDTHIFKDPKVLPCKNVGCKICIKRMIEGKRLCLCGEEHQNLDLESLQADQEKVNEINLKATEITEEIIDKLLRFADGIAGTAEEREKKIDEICDRVKNDIEKRVEEIKIHLDKLHGELKTQLKTIKDKVYEELSGLNKEVDEKTKEYKEFADKMQAMLDNFEENREQLQKDIYTCQEHIETLKRLDDNFHKILRKVSFEPSEWVPDASYIGTFNCPELLEDLENLQGSDEEDEDKEDDEN